MKPIPTDPALEDEGLVPFAWNMAQRPLPSAGVEAIEIVVGRGFAPDVVDARRRRTVP
jgi:hypothetical protein